MGLHKDWYSYYWKKVSKDITKEGSTLNAGGAVYGFGAEDFQARVLQMLNINYTLVKNSVTLSDFDELRTKEIMGIYEDLIKSVENLKPE